MSESNMPSTMDLNDLLEMAISSGDNDSCTTVTEGRADVSVPQQSNGSPSHLKINYNYRLLQRIGSLPDSGMFSDVKFIVGEEKEIIHGHKLIMALSSPVFTSMFYSETLKSEDIIEIPDCRPHAFQALIQFIYKEALDLDETEVPYLLSVLYAARKYAVKGLEDKCAIKLSSILDNDNVFEVLHASNLHSLNVLEGECWQYIEENVEMVLTAHLDNLDFDILNLILRNNNLNIEEAKLFELVFRWARNECQLKGLAESKENVIEIGKPLFEQIRFPVMNATEFADKVVPSGILNTEQIARILTFICTSSENKGLYKMEFPINEREPRFRFQSQFQSFSSLSGPSFITFGLQRDENQNVPAEPEQQEQPRSRRSRRSRRRNSPRLISPAPALRI